jgi:flagellar motor switch protein FliG
METALWIIATASVILLVLKGSEAIVTLNRMILETRMHRDYVKAIKIIEKASPDALDELEKYMKEMPLRKIDPTPEENDERKCN